MNSAATGLLCARLVGNEILVAPERRALVESLIQGFAGHDRATELLTDFLADDFWPAASDWRATYRPYVVQNGILKVPVMGMLLNRFGYQVGSFATGYTYIQKAVERGMMDPEVKGIALVVDSPGGEVAGCFELVDKLYDMRGEKPIRAFAADHAYSAAYAIASVGNSITMTRSGGVGSIGVVTMHVDYSALMAASGIKVTFIYAGKHKVDGNPYQKLPADVRERIQARIDSHYAVFTSTVARNRGMDEKKVRATEALTYGSDDAIKVGLADKVAVFEDAIAAFADDWNTDTDSGDDEMTDVKKADHEAAVAAARDEGAVAGFTAGRTEGVKAERERIAAIMGHANAKSRQETALTLATTTDLSADQAAAILATVPEAAKATSGNKALFDAAMTATGNPEVGAGAASKPDDQDDSPAARSAGILANFRALTGSKVGERKQ